MRYANSRNCENLEKYVFNGCGKYDIPRLDPESYEGEHEFISFNYARTAKNRNGKVCHFLLMIINSRDCGRISMHIFPCYKNLIMC